MAAQLSTLMEKFEQQQAEPELLRHLVSLNSSNSSTKNDREPCPTKVKQVPDLRQRSQTLSGRLPTWVFDSAVAEEEAVRDLGVGQALRDQAQHLAFPRTQRPEAGVVSPFGTRDEPFDQPAGDVQREQRASDRFEP